jgi:hypothetical protein
MARNWGEQKWPCRDYLAPSGRIRVPLPVRVRAIFPARERNLALTARLHHRTRCLYKGTRLQRIGGGPACAADRRARPVARLDGFDLHAAMIFRRSDKRASCPRLGASLRLCARSCASQAPSHADDPECESLLEFPYFGVQRARHRRNCCACRWAGTQGTTKGAAPSSDRRSSERWTHLMPKRRCFVLHPGISLVLAERLRLAVDIPIQAYADRNARRRWWRCSACIG